MKDPLLGNKIAGALLAALLLFFGLPQLANALFGGGGHGGGHEAEGEDHAAHPFPQFPIAYAGAESAGEEKAAEPDLGTLLAAANPAAGERRAAICKSCHTFDKGGANGTGPNLWDIVNRPVAGHEGFNYTPALKAFGGVWSYEHLDGFLKNSAEYVPGTGMAQRFPKAEQRAELLAYLATLSDNPVPFPAPAAPAEEESAPADGAEGEEHASLDEDAAPYVEGVKPVEEPSEPSSEQKKKIELGSLLYHDTRLSADGSVSCATCHDLALGGVDRLPTSTGIKGQHGPINSPTVFNSVHNFVQFWDGRAGSLEEQAAGPVENPLEMGDAWDAVVEKISADPDYVAKFADAYNGAITKETITSAIADFERTLVTPNSPFDKYVKGDKTAISDEAKRGFILFNETGCASCHNGDYFGGTSFQVLAQSYFDERGTPLTDADLGRFSVTGNEADRHAFKSPMLRNVGVTPPYFHDGSTSDLTVVVKKMGRHQLKTELSDEDANAIVAFLKTLTGEYQGVPLDKMGAQ